MGHLPPDFPFPILKKRKTSGASSAPAELNLSKPPGEISGAKPSSVEDDEESQLSVEDRNVIQKLRQEERCRELEATFGDALLHQQCYLELFVEGVPSVTQPATPHHFSPSEIVSSITSTNLIDDDEVVVMGDRTIEDDDGPPPLESAQ